MATTFETARLEFDTTADEIVDIHVRRTRGAPDYRRQRTRYQWLVGGCLALSWMVSIVWQGRDLPVTILVVVAAIGLGGGALLGYAYGRFQDWYVRYTYRRMIRQLYGDGPIRCQVELRPGALWARVSELDNTYPWSEMTRVDETGGAIELWFGSGLVVVRDRAFRTTEDRRQFLAAARGYLETRTA